MYHLSLVLLITALLDIGTVDVSAQNSKYTLHLIQNSPVVKKCVAPKKAIVKKM